MIILYSSRYSLILCLSCGSSIYYAGSMLFMTVQFNIHVYYCQEQFAHAHFLQPVAKWRALFSVVDCGVFLRSDCRQPN